MNYAYPPPPAPNGSPLDVEINQAVAQGWTVVNRDTHNAVLNKGGKVRHVMHGVISLLTCGVWLWGWALFAILGARQVMTLTMDQSGHVSRVGPKSRTPYLAGLGGLFLVLVIIGAMMPGGADPDDSAADTSDAAAVADSGDTGGDSAEKEEKVAAKPKAKPAAKPVVVEVSALIKEFEASEFTADKKYKGKTLKITGGVVSSIDAQLWNDDKYDVSFTGGGDFEILSVTCRSVADKYLETLEPGQDVTVVGKFDDGGDLGIEMKSCTF